METDAGLLRRLALAMTVLAALATIAGLAAIGLTGKSYLDHRRVVAERQAALDAEWQRNSTRGYYYPRVALNPDNNRFLDPARSDAPGWQAVAVAPAGIAGIVSLVLLAAFFAVTLGFVWRAHANLRERGVPISAGPRRAVANYCIPLLNFVLPFEAMRELVNRSEGEGDDFAHMAVPDVTAWWTAAAVGAAMVVLVLTQTLWNIASPLKFVTPEWMQLVLLAFAALLLLASTVLLAGLARRVAGAQAALLPELAAVPVHHAAPARPNVRIVERQTTGDIAY